MDWRVLSDEPFSPVAILLIDVPDADGQDALSWRTIPGFPKLGYQRARIYLRHRGAPYARLAVNLDERGFPFGSPQEVLFTADLALAHQELRPESNSTLPLVSVVVSTSGFRPQLLKRCIKSLLSLEYPTFEIVLVDNRPNFLEDDDEIWTDLVDQVSEKSRRLRIVREFRPGLSYARNAGVLAASGEIIAFTDDDVEVEANWLSELIDAFNMSIDVQCVTGLVIPRELKTEAQELFEKFYGGFERGLAPHFWIMPNRKFPSRVAFGRTSFLVTEDESPIHQGSKSIYVVAGTCGVGANMAVRRDFALRHPFDVGLGAGSYVDSGEDIRFFADVLWSGSGIAYAPSAIVRHTHRREIEDLMAQVRRCGSGETAMLASLMLQDARHVVGIAVSGAPSALLRWFRSAFSGQSAAEGRDEEHSYPPSIRRTELVGMLLGPSRYILSRVRVRYVTDATSRRRPESPTL
jgi:GT2 family glycosyltransferase